MYKDKNVNIKLELDRDNAGKLRLIAHFNSKASNIFINKDEYVWMPTLEEKDLIDEAFSFINSKTSPIDPKNLSKNTVTSQIDEKINKEVEPKTVFEKKADIKPEVPEEKNKESSHETSVFERIKRDDAVFEVKDQVKDETYTEKENINIDDELEPKIEIKDEQEETSLDEKPDEDDGLIVEADEEAIREAIKKHNKEDEEVDNSIREVDEKTIIDRVLTQKKKGKWAVDKK
jgi:hypothetical protein